MTADRQRLSQILLNLLSNAVKYNREAGLIHLSIEQADPATVTFVVKDTGPGIPPAKLALLFTPFERLGAEMSGIEGTGLGLAVAKALVEAMAGALTVDSVVDEGTTFRVTLPSAARTTSRVIPVPPIRSDGGQNSGLVVYIEDNLPNVLLMQLLLARRPGVELVNASSGRVGLDIIRQRRPDLVFLDLHLPDLPGEEVLRQLWENPATRNIPVVILTADATQNGQRRLLASGATAYMTKPLDVATVLGVIDRTLDVSTGRQA